MNEKKKVLRETPIFTTLRKRGLDSTCQPSGSRRAKLDSFFLGVWNVQFSHFQLNMSRDGGVGGGMIPACNKMNLPAVSVVGQPSLDFRVSFFIADRATKLRRMKSSLIRVFGTSLS